jgi:hypothetical protein
MTGYRPTWRPTEEYKELRARVRRRRAYLRRLARANLIKQMRLDAAAAAATQTKDPQS